MPSGWSIGARAGFCAAAGEPPNGGLGALYRKALRTQERRHALRSEQMARADDHHGHAPSLCEPRQDAGPAPIAIDDQPPIGRGRDALDPLAAAAPASYRRLIIDRNARWARVLAHIARESTGVTVVVVGAGHLVGPAGVPSLLRARGLRVEGP